MLLFFASYLEVPHGKGDFSLLIKNLIKNYYDIEIPLLYGGSVNAENIELLKSLDVDGVLFGKSALDTQELIKICDSFN